MVFNIPTRSIITDDDIVCNEKRLHSKMVKVMYSSGRVTITFFMRFQLHSLPYRRYPGGYCRGLTFRYTQLQGLNQAPMASEFVVIPTELFTLRLSSGWVYILYHLYQHNTKLLHIISTIYNRSLICFCHSTSRSPITKKMEKWERMWGEFRLLAVVKAHQHRRQQIETMTGKKAIKIHFCKSPKWNKCWRYLGKCKLSIRPTSGTFKIWTPCKINLTGFQVFRVHRVSHLLCSHHVLRQPSY